MKGSFLHAMKSGVVATGLAAIAGIVAGAESARPAGAALVVASSDRSVQPSREIVRQIDDPATGERWLLERDPRHPGGPGLMVPAGTGASALEREPMVHARASSGRRDAGFETAAAPGVPLIRAGERLVVEEHTPLVDAELEAVAIEPALKGAEFNVRLAIGGRVVRAVALARGSAMLIPDDGGRR